MSRRANWIKRLEEMLRVPMVSAARRSLHKDMPIDVKNVDRIYFAHLEVVARGLAGIAPWLELQEIPSSEFHMQN